MITQLYIPVINFSDNFDYNKTIDDESYIKMLNNNYAESYYDIENYMTKGTKYQTNYRYCSPIKKDKIRDVYQYSPVEAIICDIYDNEIDSKSIEKYKSNGDMFILIVNINPDSINEDTESELLFWLTESMKINNNKLYTDDKKLLLLPERKLKMKVEEDLLTLNDCKILDVYSNIKQGKFKFAILIKNIINI